MILVFAVQHMRKVSTGTLPAAIPVPGLKKFAPSHLYSVNMEERAERTHLEPTHSIYSSDLQFLDKGS